MNVLALTLVHPTYKNIKEKKNAHQLTLAKEYVSFDTNIPHKENMNTNTKLICYNQHIKCWLMNTLALTLAYPFISKERLSNISQC